MRRDGDRCLHYHHGIHGRRIHLWDGDLVKVWKCDRCAPTPACVLTCEDDEIVLDPAHCPWLGEHKADWQEMKPCD